ncbi:MAG: bifunctional YncE family protein/alkaline phosphatase family protein [Pirellulales bacterium]|nr:bifunctional YncE family protein/alkaline phosphatase family protein [Pirellulales bacterium]
MEADDYDRLRVGDETDGRIVVPTNQVLSPLGDQVPFPNRPTAVALSSDQRWLGVLCNDCVLVIDVETKQVTGRASHTGSFTGIAFVPERKQWFASNTRGTIDVYGVDEEGHLSKHRSIQLTPRGKEKRGGVVPAGLALDPNKKTLWVACNMVNVVSEVDLASGKELRKIDVGNAPYDVVCAGGKVYVSNWAGRRPGKGDPTGPSGSAAPVRVDPRRHIASEGSVSVIDPVQGKVIEEIVVGPHAAGLAASPDGRYVCVACANADLVTVIDTNHNQIVEHISTRPSSELLLGSAPNALLFDPDGKTLYISNGTNNAVAVVAFRPSRSRIKGFLPTGWYPAGLALDPERQTLFVANIKGIGSRNTEKKGRRKVKGKVVWGFNSREPVGTVSIMPLPKEKAFRRCTQTVLTNNRLSEARYAQAKPRRNARARPVPDRVGEPSIFKHVLYIIKENRTYDQVFGDMPEGEGDPNLCIFGEEVTPNHHKLAREFVLLDNFYCSGVLSADGHQWTDEAYVTDYIEKSFGGWPRSYPYWGGDAMAYSPGGFIWDNVLAHGKTLRVYGEFVKATIRWRDPSRKGRPSFLECYRDYREGTDKIEIKATAAIKTLEPYICPTSIGFPCIVSDQYRADQFLRELKQCEAKGQLPNFMIMLLPSDHTTGTRPGMPTPAASVADNDLAVGRIVEALSRSKFWPETCIFVVQDDPQNGFDHIDGHRTVALVVSPYTRRHAVDSTNYNQTSMVRTIEQILGLPPMNQFDASATPMASCFTNRPNFEPYTAVKNNIPLDQMNPKLSDIQDQRQQHWAKVSLQLPLDDIDEADEDTLNRILWHAQTGRDDTYPAWAVLDLSDKD